MLLHVGNDALTVTENYVVMVPSFIVFDNMLQPYITELNITGTLTVIFDEKYRKFNDIVC